MVPSRSRNSRENLKNVSGHQLVALHFILCVRGKEDPGRVLGNIPDFPGDLT